MSTEFTIGVGRGRALTGTPGRHAGVLLCLLAGLGAVGCGGSDPDEGAKAAQGVQMLDPSQPHFGKTYAEWSVVWWQWFYALPGSTHPVTDATGEYCAAGQATDAPVFYLAGTGGGPVERACSFSSKQGILIPLINAAYDNGGVDPAEALPDEELADGADEFMGNAALEDFSVIVDGQVMAGLARGRVFATRFSYEVPEGDNMYTAQGIDFWGTVEPSFSAGYYVLLAPLAPGEHEISFDAHITDPEFRVSAEYHLTLE